MSAKSCSLCNTRIPLRWHRLHGPQPGHDASVTTPAPPPFPTPGARLKRCVTRHPPVGRSMTPIFLVAPDRRWAQQAARNTCNMPHGTLTLPYSGQAIARRYPCVHSVPVCVAGSNVARLSGRKWCHDCAANPVRSVASTGCVPYDTTIPVALRCRMPGAQLRNHAAGMLQPFQTALIQGIDARNDGIEFIERQLVGLLQLLQ